MSFFPGVLFAPRSPIFKRRLFFYSTDIPVDPTNFSRLGFNEDEVFYLEPRARNLDEDEARLCPLASIYVNCYFAGENEDNKETPSLRMKSLQLDSVRR